MKNIILEREERGEGRDVLDIEISKRLVDPLP